MALRLTDLQIATLAACSPQGREEVAGFIQAFSDSHRHVLSYLSYLIEEVLNR